jgi:phosphate transport system permease protein
MSSVAVAAEGLADRRGSIVDRVGDWVLRGLCALAALVALLTLVLIAQQVISGASPALSRYGLGFLGHTTWKPNFQQFGAAVMIYGTAVSSFMALALATPLGIAIGLYLALMASGTVRAIVGPMVEMLAAIPSVIVGFWGIIVLAPQLQSFEPKLHNALGFLPIFGAPSTTGTGVFTAGIILTIMILPIIAAISRDLFLTVPRELKDGAAALGATRWEVIRGVVLPSTASGVASAAILGLGRALGEAIAVTQVIGAGNLIHGSLFATGDTLASRIADQFAGAENALHTASLFYLAFILLVLAVLSNLAAHAIARRFDVSQGGAVR